jgi:hypothetical protein
MTFTEKLMERWYEKLIADSHVSTYGIELSPKREEIRKKNLESEASIRKLFKSDLLAYHDVTDGPKADMLFDKCWSNHASDGFGSVAYMFDDFVELIK